MSVYLKKRKDEETFEVYHHSNTRRLSDLCAQFPDLGVVHENDGLYVRFKGITGVIRRVRLEHGDVIVKSLTNGLYETYTNEGFHRTFEEKPPIVVQMNSPGMNEALVKAWEGIYNAYQALESVRPAGGFETRQPLPPTVYKNITKGDFVRIRRGIVTQFPDEYRITADTLFRVESFKESTAFSSGWMVTLHKYTLEKMRLEVFYVDAEHIMPWGDEPAFLRRIMD